MTTYQPNEDELGVTISLMSVLLEHVENGETLEQVKDGTLNILINAMGALRQVSTPKVMAAMISMITHQPKAFALMMAKMAETIGPEETEKLNGLAKQMKLSDFLKPGESPPDGNLFS